MKHGHRLHKSKIHGVDDPLKQLPNGDGPDLSDPNKHCTLCDRTYTSRYGYRLHSANIHNLLILPIRTGHIIPSNTAPIVDPLYKHCNVCDKLYKSPSSYRQHMVRYHHVKSFATRMISQIVNRNEEPVIDEIGCTMVQPVTKRTKLETVIQIICVRFMASYYLNESINDYILTTVLFPT